MATKPAVPTEGEQRVTQKEKPPGDGWKLESTAPHVWVRSTDGQSKRGKKSTATPEQVAARKAANRARFVKLAPKRVNATLRRLKQVKALANKSGYEYTLIEAEKIMHAIRDAFEGVCDAFTGQQEVAHEFTL